jgi:hypothetical protein
MNLDADINRKGKPIKEIICPIKKNQKEIFMKTAKMDPINVSRQPFFK